MCTGFLSGLTHFPSCADVGHFLFWSVFTKGGEMKNKREKKTKRENKTCLKKVFRDKQTELDDHEQFCFHCGLILAANWTRMIKYVNVSKKSQIVVVGVVL